MNKSDTTRKGMDKIKNLLVEALCKAQLEIKAPKKDKINPRFKNSYSSLDAIYEACRIPLARHGLTLSHTVGEGGNWVETTLRHEGGESICNRIPVYIEHQTSQGFASAYTYARRYGTSSLLGLSSDEDDDGNAAVDEEKKAPLKVIASPTQIKMLEALIAAKNDPDLRTNILNYHAKDLLNPNGFEGASESLIATITEGISAARTL